MGKLKSEERAKLVYPLQTLKPYGPASAGLDRPTGLVVEHALSELAQSPPFRGKSWDYIRNNGFDIITTVHKGAQDAAVKAADKFVKSSPMYAQNRKYQAALVAVEPGTGRVLAYFGGHNGAGVDYAGWYRDEFGEPKGRGRYPPGSSFKVYTLAAALQSGISLKSLWDSSSPHEFPPRRVGANAVRRLHCRVLRTLVHGGDDVESVIADVVPTLAPERRRLGQLAEGMLDNKSGRPVQARRGWAIGLECLQRIDELGALLRLEFAHLDQGIEGGLPPLGRVG